MVKGKIVYKFNNGNLAILCSRCSKIIKTGKDFTEQEWEDFKENHRKLPAQYCETCKEKKLMRKLKEYLESLYITKDGEPENVHDSVENVLDVLKQIQLDAIEATCKRCAEEGTVEVADYEELSIEALPVNDGRTVILPIYGVDVDSILKVADKMKEELE